MPKKNLLYLEDEGQVLANWEILLELKGYNVIGVKTVTDCMEKINQFNNTNFKIHLFILDIIVTPWVPFSADETMYGFITGLRVADFIFANYSIRGHSYKILFATAAEGVRGDVKREIDRYMASHRDKCLILKKPLDKRLMFQTIEKEVGTPN